MGDQTRFLPNLEGVFISISSEDEHEEQSCDGEKLISETNAHFPGSPVQAQPQVNGRKHPREESDDESCEFEFEGFDSDEDFIPKSAKLSRPRLLPASDCSPQAEGSKSKTLPAELQALLPAEQLSAPRELNAAHVLTDEQTRAVKYVASTARAKSEAAKEGLQRRLAKWGYDKDTLEKVLTYIRDEAPIVIHTDLSKRLNAFNKDTHYRNQFETGTTSGSSDMSKRKAWESRLFPDIYDTVEATHRVKYGVLNAVNDPRGIMSVAKQYGQDYLVLRGVRLRTTFSDRDSCTQGQQASCEWYAHVLEKYTDTELQAVTEVALGDRLFVDSSVLDTAAGGYKEVQIHGEVEFKKHLEAVVVHHSRKKSKVLYSGIVEWCNSIGVPLLCMPEFCDGTALICGQSNPGTQLTAETPLWRWRPEKSTGPWVRFDAVGSSVLEARRRRETVEFPCMPVGQISNLNMAALTASLLIGNISVELALQRRTAGDGAREQEAGAAGAAGCAIWEWCASASGHGAWCRYADTVSTALEKAWKSKTSHTWFRVEESTYQLDFELMVQVNCETKYRRLVRRRNNGS
ncbi:unnamed protein product [Cladocopium goreaui]|uniref:Rhodanese domain-containing protein n=1 Tax=Cladocopium goreaui TaxID=2562237 RepID=A0A9P1BVY6_9DINO|nr:unnamed protein product [Cladocopium goreaui]